MFKEYLKKPLSISLVLCALVITGIASIVSLPTNMYPNMVKPSFNIWFGHEDISVPSDMYKNFGKGILDQIIRLKGIEDYSETYYAKQGRIKLNFEWDIDEEDIESKIENIFTPYTSQYTSKFWYQIEKGSSRAGGNMRVAVSHKVFNSEELRELLDLGLRPILERIKDVEKVNFWGWAIQQKAIIIDRDKLLGYQLDINDVTKRIKQSFSTLNVGTVGGSKRASEKYTIIVPPDIEDMNSILQVKLKSKPSLIRLKDIAKFSAKTASSDSYYSLNGNPANFLNIDIKSGADVKKTCDLIIQKLKTFGKGKNGLDIEVIINPSDFIMRSIKNLLVNALVGGIVAIVVILLFLGSWRNTIIIASSIPFCVITSFLFMKIFGVSINIISLGGLAIGVGMIVDSSIVSLENIHRFLQKSNLSKVEAIYQGVKEVSLPVISSILTSIVVFIPIIFTQSYTKAILGDLAKVVAFTLLTSVISALIVVPVLSNLLMKKQTETSSNNNYLRLKSFSEKIKNLYTKILVMVIKTKRRSFSIIFFSFVLFAASLFLIGKIKKEVMAKPTTNLLVLRYDIPDNKDPRLSKELALKAEKFFLERKEVISFLTFFWRPDGGVSLAVLKDRSLYKKMKEIAEKEFENTPDYQVKVRKWDPGKMPLPDQDDLVINISGGNQNQQTEFSDLIMSLSNKVGANMWRRPWMSKSEGIKINPKSWLEKDDFNKVKNYLQTATDRGLYVMELFENGKKEYINVFFKEDQRLDFLEDLSSFPIFIKNKIIPLKAVAEVERVKESYVPIRFVDGTPMQQIFVNYKNKNKGDKLKKSKDLKGKINQLEKATSLTIEYPDTNKEVTRSFSSFQISLLISILLVFLIIALLFNDWKYPLIIIITVPLGIIGVLSGLFIMDSTLSLNSMLGTILLAGLVVNNAILLIDFYRKEKEHSDNVKKNILEAAQLRFRPIIMTTLTTLLGVVPIVLAFGEGGEILQPLGISVFFGLLFSTLLTLIVIPSLINLTES